MKLYRNRQWQLLLLVIMLTLLGSCGGGSSGSLDQLTNSIPEVTTSPQVAAPGLPDLDTAINGPFSEATDPHGLLALKTPSEFNQFTTVRSMVANIDEIKAELNRQIADGTPVEQLQVPTYRYTTEYEIAVAAASTKGTSAAGDVTLLAAETMPVMGDNFTGTAYKFSYAMEQVRPVNLVVNSNPEGTGKFYLAVGNFTRGRWDYVGTGNGRLPGDTNPIVLNSEQVRDRFVSAPERGNIFVAYVIADNGLTIQSVDLQVVNKDNPVLYTSTKPAMPTGTAVTVLGLPQTEDKGASAVSNAGGADIMVEWDWEYDGSQTTLITFPLRGELGLASTDSDLQEHVDDEDNAPEIDPIDNGVSEEYFLVNMTYENGFSAPVSAGEILIPILPPTDLAGSFEAGEATLSWTRSNGATQYEVHRSIAGGAFELIATLNDVSVYSDDDPEILGNQVGYKLKGKNNITTSDFTDVVNVNCSALPTVWQSTTVETLPTSYHPQVYLDGSGTATHFYSDDEGLKTKSGMAENTVDTGTIRQLDYVRLSDSTFVIGYSKPDGVYCASYADGTWTTVAVEAGANLGNLALDVELLGAYPAFVYNDGTDIRARRASMAKPATSDDFAAAHVVVADADDPETGEVRFLHLLSNVDAGHLPTIIYNAKAGGTTRAISASGPNITQPSDWANAHTVTDSQIQGLDAVWNGERAHLVFVTESGLLKYAYSTSTDDDILETGEWLEPYVLATGTGGQPISTSITTVDNCPTLVWIDNAGDAWLADAAVEAPTTGSTENWQMSAEAVASDASTGGLYAPPDIAQGGGVTGFVFLEEIDADLGDFDIVYRYATE